MPSHSEQRILPYTAEQLFDVVMDIEKYPEFLPWCIGARINSRTVEELDADVIIGYKIFREKFSSRVHYKTNKEIEVEYLRGPMRHLHNKWIFTPRKGRGCQVDFYVDFSLKTKLMESLVDQFFQTALVRMIDAFEKRVKDLHG